MLMDKLVGVTQAIEDYYHQNEVSERLVQAILYSIHAGGKRLRPMLLLDLLESLGQALTPAHFQIAAALEMIHTGSLIHDDLPAMDNDDYRRGQLTNHKKFDEATAILAGDSLFLDPFGLIAQSDLAPSIKLDLIVELSDASGTFGMVGGQMLDIMAENQDLQLADLEKIHENKTGRLLRFPFVAAALMTRQNPENVSKFRQMGDLLGLAFQVRDDILDVTATFEEIGKTPNKDIEAKKVTYPSLLGLEKSHTILSESLDKVLDIAQDLEKRIVFETTGLKKHVERLRLDA